MVEELRHAVEQVEQLPEEAQRHIAAVIQEELEEQEWGAIVSKPTVRNALRRMAAEARRQAATGETEESGWEL